VNTSALYKLKWLLGYLLSCSLSTCLLSPKTKAEPRLFAKPVAREFFPLQPRPGTKSNVSGVTWATDDNW